MIDTGIWITIRGSAGEMATPAAAADQDKSPRFSAQSIACSEGRSGVRVRLLIDFGAVRRKNSKISVLHLGARRVLTVLGGSIRPDLTKLPSTIYGNHLFRAGARRSRRTWAKCAVNRKEIVREIGEYRCRRMVPQLAREAVPAAHCDRCCPS